jgi:hypothetical protein
MPIDPVEAVKLSTQAAETGFALKAALDVNGPGGKTITRVERNKLLRLTVMFLLALVMDVVD